MMKKKNSKLQVAEKQIENIIKLLKTNKEGNLSKHGIVAILIPLIYNCKE